MSKLYGKQFKLYEETGDNIGYVELVDHMGTDLTVVNAARVSFGVKKEKLDQKDKKLLGYLIKHRHTSTLEHNVMTCKFKVPIFVVRQHHRHRTWSYNEISRRYTSVNLEFYGPKKFRTQHKNNRQASNFDELLDPMILEAIVKSNKIPKLLTKLILKIGKRVPVANLTASQLVTAHHKASIKLFNLLLDVGVCREQARGVLPQNMYTTYIGTVNLNNLIKFIELRIHKGAQWEIIQVAKKLLEIAANLWPETVQKYKDIRGL